MQERKAVKLGLGGINMSNKKTKKVVDNWLKSSYSEAEKRGIERKKISEFFYRLRDIVHTIEVDWRQTDYMVADVKNLIKEFEKGV